MSSRGGYWCHNCRVEVHANLVTGTPLCPRCQSDFMEEIEEENDPRAFRPAVSEDSAPSSGSPRARGGIRIIDLLNPPTLSSSESNIPDSPFGHTRQPDPMQAFLSNLLMPLMMMDQDAQGQEERARQSAARAATTPIHFSFRTTTFPAASGVGNDDAGARPESFSFDFTTTTGTSGRNPNAARTESTSDLGSGEEDGNTLLSENGSTDSLNHPIAMLLRQIMTNAAENGRPRHEHPFMHFFNLPFAPMGVPVASMGDYAMGQTGFEAILQQLMEQHTASNRPPPLSKTQLDTLPRVTFTVPAGGEEVDCAVCLEKFKDGEESLIKLPACGHLFHPSCIEHWLQVTGTCPTCRKPVAEGTPNSPSKEEHRDSGEHESGADGSASVPGSWPQ